MISLGSDANRKRRECVKAATIAEKKHGQFRGKFCQLEYYKGRNDN